MTVEKKVIGKIGPGLLLFVGIRDGDSAKEIEWLTSKLVGLRIFPDEAGKMNLSVADVAGEILIVSQFTLYGNCEKGRRPSFIGAAEPSKAEKLYLEFVQKVNSLIASQVQTGRFGAMMDVQLINDGPVTLLLERDSLPLEN